MVLDSVSDDGMRWWCGGVRLRWDRAWGQGWGSRRLGSHGCRGGGGRSHWKQRGGRGGAERRGVGRWSYGGGRGYRTCNQLTSKGRHPILGSWGGWGGVAEGDTALDYGYAPVCRVCFGVCVSVGAECGEGYMC